MNLLESIKNDILKISEKIKLTKNNKKLSVSERAEMLIKENANKEILCYDLEQEELNQANEEKLKDAKLKLQNAIDHQKEVEADQKKAVELYAKCNKQIIEMVKTLETIKDLKFGVELGGHKFVDVFLHNNTNLGLIEFVGERHPFYGNTVFKEETVLTPNYERDTFFASRASKAEKANLDLVLKEIEKSKS